MNCTLLQAQDQFQVTSLPIKHGSSDDLEYQNLKIQDRIKQKLHMESDQIKTSDFYNKERAKNTTINYMKRGKNKTKLYTIILKTRRRAFQRRIARYFTDSNRILWSDKNRNLCNP